LLSANRKNRAVFFEKLRLYKLYCQATGQGQADGPSYLDVSPSRNPKQQGLSKKDPRINDAQLEVPTFEASATNIGHKDYAPPPKEPSDNDFPMTKTGILSSRFLTLPANFSFFHFPPSLSRTRWIRSVWSPWTLRPRWGTGDLGNRRKLKMTRWNTSVTLRFIPPYHGNSCHSNDVLWLA